MPLRRRIRLMACWLRLFRYNGDFGSGPCASVPEWWLRPVLPQCVGCSTSAAAAWESWFGDDPYVRIGASLLEYILLLLTPLSPFLSLPPPHLPLAHRPQPRAAVHALGLRLRCGRCSAATPSPPPLRSTHRYPHASAPSGDRLPG